MAWTSFDTPAQIFRHRNAGDGEKKIHPTQKPICLYDWIMDKYAKPGMKILDTHVGSGSSRIAAYKAGLDFIGYEIDKDYFDVQDALNRINALKELGVIPFAQPYRDFDNMTEPTQEQKDLARWCNMKATFKTCTFEEYNRHIKR